MHRIEVKVLDSKSTSIGFTAVKFSAQFDNRNLVKNQTILQIEDKI